MQGMRDRTRTDLARPRSPSRQASRQTSYSRSFSRRSGDGDTDDGNDDPDIMEAAGTIGRSVSVARPQSAPLRLYIRAAPSTRGPYGGAAAGESATDGGSG